MPPPLTFRPDGRLCNVVTKAYFLSGTSDQEDDSIRSPIHSCQLKIRPMDLCVLYIQHPGEAQYPLISPRGTLPAPSPPAKRQEQQLQKTGRIVGLIFDPEREMVAGS